MADTSLELAEILGVNAQFARMAATSRALSEGIACADGAARVFLFAFKETTAIAAGFRHRQGLTDFPGVVVVGGNTIMTTLVTYNDENWLMDADGPGPRLKVAQKLDQGATKVLVDETLTPGHVGTYHYNWDTREATPGDYAIIWTGSVGGKRFRKEEQVRVLTPTR